VTLTAGTAYGCGCSEPMNPADVLSRFPDLMFL